MSGAAAETARVTAAFAAVFGPAPELVARAPGRVNLIGEHTDYNDGFVLPCAIDHATTVAIARAAGGETRVHAVDYGEDDRFAVDRPIGHRAESGWSDHVRGIHAAFARRGLAVPAADIAIGGDVPRGAGLSSSASLGVALAAALAAAGCLDQLSSTDFALIARESENDFVGVACGIMDQLVSARAESGSALLIDCRSLEVRPVAIPADAAVLVIHSGVERGLVGSAYNERRRQCEAAARHYGVAALRDLDRGGLEAGRDGLDVVAFARARHVVTENARALAAADALAADDLAVLGQLFAASHASMRDDFAITVPAVDALVALAQAAIGGEGGARMTGGGFGGAIVAMCRRDRAAGVIAAVCAEYRTPAGEAPLVLDITPSAGVGVIAVATP